MAEYQTFSFMMRMKVQQMKMMKRLKEQMAQLQEAAEERARQAEKDKVSTALLGLYWFIAPNNRHPTTIILIPLVVLSAIGAGKWRRENEYRRRRG